jgi:hypothetical protein
MPSDVNLCSCSGVTRDVDTSHASVDSNTVTHSARMTDAGIRRK